MNTRIPMAGVWCLALMCAIGATAQEETETSTDPALELVPADTLGELLDNVEQRRVVESREHVRREQEFLQRKNEQQRMLDNARAERRREEQRSERLETRFEENEILIGERQEQLDKRLGSLRELFGVLQQVAGDVRGQFEGSVISIEYPNRGDWLGEFAAKMGTATQLATIHEMENLWFEMQREMTESGKITRFDATVNMLNGERVESEVIRVGAFNVVSDGKYINYDVNSGELVQLARQPSARFSKHRRRSHRRRPRRSGRLRHRPVTGVDAEPVDPGGHGRRAGRYAVRRHRQGANAGSRSATGRAATSGPSSSSAACSAYCSRWNAW